MQFVINKLAKYENGLTQIIISQNYMVSEDPRNRCFAIACE